MYSYYNFPKDKELRETWIRNISRAGNSGRFSKFQPTMGHRVCSAHFVGGSKARLKTTVNATPKIFPQREIAVAKRRIPVRRRLELSKQNTCNELIELELEVGEPVESNMAPTRSESGINHDGHEDHTYCVYPMPDLATQLKDQRNTVLEMASEIDRLKQKVAELECQLKEKTKTFNEATKEASQHRTKSLQLNRRLHMQSVQHIQLKKVTKKRLFGLESMQDDKMMRFYTGLNLCDFKQLYAFVEPDIKCLVFWGSRKAKSHSQDNMEKENSLAARALTPENELFLMLTRLRQGLLEQDLAYRYSYIINSKFLTCILNFCMNYDSM